ncbi:MAG: leucine-rich repeat protein [Clostridia bacterium]|nr:leucine-rich repeat protein [Clostridia bacterium]
MNKSKKLTFVVTLLLLAGAAISLCAFSGNFAVALAASNEVVTDDGLILYPSDDGYVVCGRIDYGSSVIIPDEYGGLPVTEIDYMAFYNDSCLVSLYIGKNVRVIGESAFYGCDLLEEIYYDAVNAEDLVTGNNVFESAGTNGSGIIVTIGRDCERIPARLFCPYSRSGAPKVTSVTLEEGSRLESSGEDAFYLCSSLTSFCVESSSDFVSVNFENENANPLYVASSNGGGLYVQGVKTKVVDTGSSESVGSYALASNGAVSTVYISSSVKCIKAHAFEGNSDITSLTIPSGVSFIGEEAFSGCAGLSSVTFSSAGGWTASYGGVAVLEFSADELLDAATAAKYLTCDFAYCQWTSSNTDFGAPVISGASAKSGEMYVSGSFTVEAFDDGGIYAIAYLVPGETEYVTVYGSAVTLPKGSKNGEYVFYAIDLGGNVSEPYYVTLDDDPPKLFVSGAEFGGYALGSFTVWTEDSSPVVLYVSSDEKTWDAVEGNSFSPNAEDVDGTFWFYAEDAAKNVSETVFVTLDTSGPYGEWVESGDGYFVSFVWSDLSWLCEVNGKAYECGTLLEDEGTYVAVLTSGSGAVYSPEPYVMGHFFVAAEEVRSSCDEEGYTVFVCQKCGELTFGNFTAAGEHTFVTETEDASCVEAGHVQVVCVYCGYVESYEYIAPLGHDYVYESVAATCEEAGHTGVVCNRCGETFFTETTPALGHSYGVTYTSAGCENEECYLYTCVRCGDFYEVKSGYPLGHSYDVEVISSATCEETGERLYRCSRCGDAYYSEVAALGHSFLTTVEGGLRVLTCQRCGLVEKYDISGVEEYVASSFESVWDKYMDYVWWILLATCGVWSIFMGVRYAISSDSEDRAKAKRMITNYVLGILVIAVVFVACPALAYGIAAFVA